MKTAKDYYTETFEGLRLTVCGVAMLGVCGCRYIAKSLGRITTKKDKAPKTVDAEIVSEG